MNSVVRRREHRTRKRGREKMGRPRSLSPITVDTSWREDLDDVNSPATVLRSPMSLPSLGRTAELVDFSPISPHHFLADSVVKSPPAEEPLYKDIHHTVQSAYLLKVQTSERRKAADSSIKPNKDPNKEIPKRRRAKREKPQASVELENALKLRDQVLPDLLAKLQRRPKRLEKDSASILASMDVPSLPSRDLSSREIHLRQLKKLDQRTVAAVCPEQGVFRKIAGCSTSYGKSGENVFSAPLMPSKEEILPFIRMRHIKTILSSQGKTKQAAIYTIQCFFRRILQARRLERLERARGRQEMAVLRLQFLWRYRVTCQQRQLVRRFILSRCFQRWWTGKLRSFRERLFCEPLAKLRAWAIAQSEPSKHLEQCLRYIRWQLAVKRCLFAWRRRAREQARVARGFREASRVRLHAMIVFDCVYLHSLKAGCFDMLRRNSRANLRQRRLLAAVFLQCTPIEWDNSTRQLGRAALGIQNHRRNACRKVWAAWKHETLQSQERWQKACKFHRLHDSLRFGPAQGNACFVSRNRFLERAFGALPFFFSRWWVEASNSRIERESDLSAQIHHRAKALQSGFAALRAEPVRRRFFAAGNLLAARTCKRALMRSTFLRWRDRVARSRANDGLAGLFAREGRMRRSFRQWALHALWESPIHTTVSGTLNDICTMLQEADDLARAEQLARARSARIGLDALKASIFRTRERHAWCDRRESLRFAFYHLKRRMLATKRLRATIMVQCAWRQRRARKYLLHLYKRKALRDALWRERGSDAAEILSPFALKIQKLARTFLQRKAEQLAWEIEMENLQTRQKQQRARASKAYRERNALIANAGKAAELRLAIENATTIQRWYRGCYVRKHTPQGRAVVRLYVAAYKIQECYLRHLSRRVEASVRAQAWFRGVLDRKRVREIRKEQRIVRIADARRRAVFRALNPWLHTHAKVSLVIMFLEGIGAIRTSESAAKIVHHLRMLRELRAKHAKLVRRHNKRNAQILASEPETRLEKANQLFVRLQGLGYKTAFRAVSAREQLYGFKGLSAGRVQRVQLLRELRIRRLEIFHKHSERCQPLLAEKPTSRKEMVIHQALRLEGVKNAACYHAARTTEKVYALAAPASTDPVTAQAEQRAGERALELEETDLEPIPSLGPDAREQLRRRAATEKTEALHRALRHENTRQKAATIIQAAFRGKSTRARYQRERIRAFLLLQDPKLLESLRRVGIIGRQDQMRAIQFRDRLLRKTPWVAKASYKLARRSPAGLRRVARATRIKKLVRLAQEPVPPIPTMQEREWLKRKARYMQIAAPTQAARLEHLDQQWSAFLQQMLKERFSRRRGQVFGRKERREELAPEIDFTNISYYAQQRFHVGSFSFAGLWIHGNPCGYGRAFDFGKDSICFKAPALLGQIHSAVGTWTMQGQTTGVFQINYSCGSKYLGLVSDCGLPNKRGTLASPPDSPYFIGLLDLAQPMPRYLLDQNGNKSTPWRFLLKKPLRTDKAYNCDADYPSWRLNTEWDLDDDQEIDEFVSLGAGQVSESAAMNGVIVKKKIGRYHEQQERLALWSVYDGEWNSHGQFHGRGILTLCNGTEFRGCFCNGKPSGFGQARYSDGSTYVGDFVEGKQSGMGMFTSRMPPPREGNNGEKDKEPGFADPDLVEYRYEGGWKNGCKHGYGRELFGDFGYQGPFRDGRKNGRGIEIYAVDHPTGKLLRWRPGIWESGNLFRFLSAEISVKETEDFLARLTPKSSLQQDQDACYTSALAISVLTRYEERTHLETAFRVPPGVDGNDERVTECINGLQDYWASRKLLETVDNADANLTMLLKAQALLVSRCSADFESLLEAHQLLVSESEQIFVDFKYSQVVLDHATEVYDAVRFDYADRIAECEAGPIFPLVDEADKFLCKLNAGHVRSLIEGYVSRPPTQVRRAIGFLGGVLAASENKLEKCRVALSWTSLDAFVDVDAWRDVMDVFLTEEGDVSTVFLGEMADSVRHWKQSLDPDRADKRIKLHFTSEQALACFEQSGALSSFLLDPRHDPDRLIREGGDSRLQAEALYALWKWILAWYACARVNQVLKPFHERLRQEKHNFQQARDKHRDCSHAYNLVCQRIDASKAKIFTTSEALMNLKQTQSEMKVRLDMQICNIELSRELAAEELASLKANQWAGPDYLVLDWNPKDIEKTKQLLRDGESKLAKVNENIAKAHQSVVEKSARIAILEEAIQVWERTRQAQTLKAEKNLSRITAEHWEALDEIGASAPQYLFCMGRVLCAIYGLEEISWVAARNLLAPKTFNPIRGKSYAKGNKQLVSHLLKLDKHECVYKRASGFMHHAIESCGLSLEYTERHMANNFSSRAASAGTWLCEWVLAMNHWALVEQSVDPLLQERKRLECEIQNHETELDAFAAEKEELEKATDYRKLLLSEIRTVSNA